MKLNHFSKAGVLTVLLLLTYTIQAALPTALLSRDGVPTLAPMLEKVLPTVVNIEVQATVRARQQSPFPFPFDDFFNMPNRPHEPQKKRRSGTGSGVIIDAAKGHIVTNNHVIAQADTIFVKLQDGNRYEATVVGADPDTDIAVLEIEADNLTAITIGDSEKLRVGDFVIAIGNPFGLSHSVTSGIVSGLSRSNLGIESYEDFIQTDASINPGNSGGALIDLNGRLIGINTAILGPSGGNIGIGFAIPINMVNDISEQILTYGEVRRGLLGVKVQSLTPDLADAFDIEQTRGAVIVEVEPDSPADGAGIEPGDVILAVNGRAVDGASDMRNYIGLLRAGTNVSIKILRDKKEKTLMAVITERKKTILNGKKFSLHLDDVLLQAVNQDTAPYKKSGILIKDIKPNSTAFGYGLRKGDLIVAVNRQRVKNFSDLENVMDNERALLLNLQRGIRSLFLILK